MATTYNNLYLDIRQQLRRAGIEEATLEARELVCFATGKTREELARDGGLYASPELERRTRELVDRHLAGEPVAYLIGEWEFYGLPLDISRDVLIPRPDTEVLAEQAIGYIQTLGECRVLDLCAGSGCIGLAVASQAPQARVVLGEWSDSALKICRQNIRRNGLTGPGGAGPGGRPGEAGEIPGGVPVHRLQSPVHPPGGYRDAGHLRPRLRAPSGPGRRRGRPGLLPEHLRKVEGGSGPRRPAVL